MPVENTLGTVHMYLCWIFWPWWHCRLSVIVVHLAYGGHFLQKASVTSQNYYPFCMKMSGVIHPPGQLFMAVHLMGYGSVPILRSMFHLSLNQWEAPGWQVIAIDDDVKQVITSYLQTLDNSVFTLEYKPWYRFGANASALHVSCVDQSHNYILTWECLFLYFLKVLCIYIAAWAGEFINTRWSELWGFFVICW